jgi:glycosyltransferase involved in cell wall biosynthesis
VKLLITIPCYNEEVVLEKTVFSVMQYAREHLSNYDWKLLILENNSKDKTWEIAKNLKENNPEIIIDEVKSPGRGRALRESWARHPDYDIYAYMDADLATDIKDFSFIISKVEDGIDMVVGSRYIPYANVKRNILRKILSHIYNFLLHRVLKVTFKDAQCGFKAMSKRLVHEMVPKTRHDGWFWDTELIIIALHHKYTLLEVPVTWREVRDELRRSTVSVWLEVVRNLKNIWMMRQSLRNNEYGA